MVLGGMDWVDGTIQHARISWPNCRYPRGFHGFWDGEEEVVRITDQSAEIMRGLSCCVKRCLLEVVGVAFRF